MQEANFPGKQRKEFVEIYLRRHFWALLVPCLVLGLAAFLLGALGYYWWGTLRFELSYVQNETLFFLFYILILLIFHLCFVKILNYILAIKIITNSRIINLRATALLRRESEMAELSKIQDFSVIQNGISKRLLNFGTIIMHDASGQKIFSFTKIPKPHKKLNAISHIYKKALTRQGTTL